VEWRRRALFDEAGKLLVPALDRLVAKGFKIDSIYLNLIKRSLEEL
jgi:hypothetical protein